MIVEITSLTPRFTFIYAAIAIALTFRAGLFNIGVEGQLRLGSLFAAYFGAMIVLPPVLHILAIFIIAMFVGGLWAAIAAYMKVKRGVSEVISTIKLNTAAKTGAATASAIFPGLNLIMQRLSLQNQVIQELSLQGLIRQ